ncbi:MAG: fused response regulator/thioredoxin-disulfide reductase, partial [Acidimicrobiia bacterium]
MPTEPQPNRSQITTSKRPVILTVDDEPEVLNSVARDLRRHYARDYQVLPVLGGAEAIEALEGLALKDGA